MSLPPNFRPMLVAGAATAPHTLDIFLDYVCPFSAKFALAIENVLRPLLSNGGQYDGKVKAIIRLQVQPWHASSTLTHEAALAVLRTSPDHFWPFSLALFKDQESYFDIPTSNMTPIQIRAKLAELASSVTGSSGDKFKDALTLKGSKNGGTDVTDDLKWTIKFSRQNGIHVSPSVLWDGLLASEISSSWGEKEWNEYLSKKVIV